MKFKILYSIFALCILTTTSLAAQKSRTTMTYAVGIPTGDLSDFISKPSWRGVSVDLIRMLDTNIGLGASFGWNVFYDARDYDTYSQGTASLSGKQYRYSNHIPMLVNFNYYMNPGQKMIPYVSLGSGVIYTRRNTDMNLYTFERDSWNFALQPQIGLEFDNSYSSAFTISAKYFYGFSAGDFDKAQSYITINVGWTFRT
jgi:hypothetical protein